MALRILEAAPTPCNLTGSIAAWTEAEAETWIGFLPPTVTVTASTDWSPLPAVITNSPHRASGKVELPVGPPYWTSCWSTHWGTSFGTVATMEVSLQFTMPAVKL